MILNYSQECHIQMALNTIRSDLKISIYHTAKIYEVPEQTLHHRMKGIQSKANTRNG
ncbi:uncharacterized protein EI97DRAFT_385795 [Westerdykella ornata]|uniref:HTH psq-type domain-containing protein n=1 Tax=Westerdykella ornata TaxID=318751 RepID=A0A6A6J8E8_WESOR|nr:uncharacterized protein EI97DRAFT_385795 [Westerdykella ornata]KAF2272474.1 hypothetical protein EI97DRAFT_385795 [Westerdykella ornata]